MALRKAYQETIEEKELFDGQVLKAEVTALPFAFSLDNGVVRIVQKDEKGRSWDVYLSYDMIARLYGIVFPSRTFICGPDGCAIDVPNHATLSKQDHLVMWAKFPETKPADISEDDSFALEMMSVLLALK